MANWLAQQENLIAIRPRDPEDRPITSRPISSDGALVHDGHRAALLFGNAVRVWWKRR